jgi:SAM-dependent methyltransferase
MSARGISADRQPDGAAQYYDRDFWLQENQKYAERHYRLQKSARIITTLAGGRERELLDLGCGPATLRGVLPANIHYNGIDIAIHSPAPYLMELDFAHAPIDFGGRSFDIVLAQGVFEYMGDCESQKFAEIASILNQDGTFMVSYVNFSHRMPKIYPIYNNIHSPEEFRQSLSRCFRISKVIPVSYNWTHSDPNRRLIKTLNLHFDLKLPLVSDQLVVEYYFICSPKRSA